MNAFTLKNLFATYSGNNYSLKNISLEIHANSFTSVIGQNGSGKTTLLKILAGIQKYSGSAQFQNYEINSISRKNFSRSVSFMLSAKNFNPAYPFTVQEIISMGRLPYRNLFSGLNSQDKKIIFDSAEITHVTHLLNRNITSLSDGEKQLVLFACILAQNTDIILLDEPTASLDPDKSAKIFHILRKLKNNGKTIIAAIHDINSSFAYSDFYVALKNGVLISHGQIHNINSEVLRDIYDSNFIPYVNYFNQERDDLMWCAVP